MPTNKQIVERFFNPRYGAYHSSYNNISFYGDTFYSYNTAIARMVQGKQSTVLLLSSNNHSRTTAKHISLVRSKAPADMPIIYVPTVRGERTIDIDTVIVRLLQRLFELQPLIGRAKKYRDEAISVNAELWRINYWIKDIDIPKELTSF